MKYIVNNLKFFIVIGLLAFAFGCEKAKTTGNTTTSNTAKSPAKETGIPANAPLGAMPPNMLGAPNATVSVEEFADFQCPTCASVHTIMKNVQAAYGSRIKFVYRSYPLTQIHKNAYDAAVAAEAAGAQGKFWDMQNQLFTNQQAWANSGDARTVFAGYAEKIGIDVEKFKADMLSFNTKGRVDADIARGRALNLTSTPTIFINGKSIPFEQMNLDALKQIIDAELAKGGAQTQTVPSAPANTTNSATNSASNSSSNTAKANTNK